MLLKTAKATLCGLLLALQTSCGEHTAVSHPEGSGQVGEPTEAGNEAEPKIPDTVRLTSAAIAEAGIRTSKSQPMDLERLLVLTGTVRSVPFGVSPPTWEAGSGDDRSRRCKATCQTLEARTSSTCESATHPDYARPARSREVARAAVARDRAELRLGHADRVSDVIGVAHDTRVESPFPQFGATRSRQLVSVRDNDHVLTLGVSIPLPSARGQGYNARAALEAAMSAELR